jgi:hypothetical protein
VSTASYQFIALEASEDAIETCIPVLELPSELTDGWNVVMSETFGSSAFLTRGMLRNI